MDRKLWRLVPRADYEDLVQDTFLKAMRQANTKPVENPDALFEHVLKGLWIDWLRRRDTARNYLERYGQDHQMIEMFDDTDMFYDDVRQLVSFDEYQVLVLKHLAGFNYTEIAEHLECTPRTVSNRHNSAASKLETLLHDSDTVSSPDSTELKRSN